MEKLNVELVEFIREECLDDSLLITEDYNIEDDIGISGDDAYDFIIAFGRRFNVNISNFDYSKYFESEPSLFTGEKKKRSLTVGDLNEAIKKGWL